MEVKFSVEDMINNIEKNEHFSFVRYNDGELISVMEYDFIFHTNIVDNNNHYPNCDGHHYFKEMNKGLQQALFSMDNNVYSKQSKYIFQVFIDEMMFIINSKKETNYEYTINKLEELKKLIKVEINKNNSLTYFFSHYIYDINYVPLIVKFVNILNTKNIILIGPEYLNKFTLLNVQKHIITPMYDCFLEKDRLIKEIENTMDDFENNKSYVFLFSASMTTNYIIDKLFKKSLDKHTMIDVGSLWDNFMSITINPVARRIYNPEFIKNNYPSNYWHE